MFFLPHIFDETVRRKERKKSFYDMTFFFLPEKLFCD
jgi:hypothetical protein